MSADETENKNDANGASESKDNASDTSADQRQQVTGEESGSQPPPSGEAQPEQDEATEARSKSHITSSPIQVSAGTQIIGTYEIVEHINTGGMGEVYRGLNIHNDEPVAIKIVLPALAHDQKILSLFQKEATVLGRLSHDAIVRYHVFTIDPGIARPCLVMEFVDGLSLADQLEIGPMSVPDVRRLLRRVASGLSAAHRAGVVHRDLSPDNVILPGGLVENAKIIDFGIAKSAAAGAGTLIGSQFAGKYAYVAPEQLGWYDGVVTGQADIYSLGLVAAALSRGESLDMGDNPADAVRRRADVPDLDGVPDELRPLIAQMLSSDPVGRPATMDEVIALLDASDPEMAAVTTGSYPPAGSVPPGAQQTGTPSVAPGHQGAPISHAPRGTSARPSVDPTVISSSVAPAVADPSAPPADASVQGAAGDESESPFGPVPETSTATPEGPSLPQPRRGGAVKWVALVALLLAGGAGGAWYAGLIPNVPLLPGAPEQPVDAASELDGPEQAATPEPALPEISELHERLADAECVLVQPDGTDSFMGFAVDLDILDRLSGELESELPAGSALRSRQVLETQCSALQFVRELPDAESDNLRILLTRDTLGSGDNLRGTISGLNGGAVWLSLIDPRGALLDITNRIDRSEDDSAEFSLTVGRVTPHESDSAVRPLLILAVVSDSSLEIVRAIPEGAAIESEGLWSFIEEEIDDRDLRARGILGHVLFEGE